MRWSRAADALRPGAGRTTWRAVHQFVPTLRRHDAVGEHVLATQRVLRQAGLSSDIYVEHPERPEGPVRSFRAYPAAARPGDLLLYHLAAPAALAGFVGERPEPVALYYHNVTPASFYEAWSEDAAWSHERAAADVAQLARKAVVAIAASEFSRQELVAAGAGVTAVVPVLGTGLGEVSPDLRLRLELRRRHTGSRWLFVGRLAPNKRQERLIAALAVARRRDDPVAELVLVGRADPPAYGQALRRWATVLGLADVVHFVSGLSASELAAYYAESDVFVCASEHEGFCVPLIEAMSAGLPVVAAATTAIPETVGDAGVLLPRADPVLIAAAVGRLRADPERRDFLVRRGRERAALFETGPSGRLLLQALGLSAPPLPATEMAPAGTSARTSASVVSAPVTSG